MSKRRNVRIAVSRVMKAAEKRLKFLPDAKLRENLLYATNDLADAYRIGAEEAQQEIVRRLQALLDANADINSNGNAKTKPSEARQPEAPAK